MLRIFKLIVSIGYYSFRCLSTWFKLLVGIKKQGTCIVIYFHSVKSEQRSKFARQMDDLIRLATPVRSDIVEPLQCGVHHVAVTFDDGLMNVVENALPELIHRNIPATIFIPSKFLGKPAIWDIEQENQDSQEFCMTSDQLKRLPSNLVSIGSHTLTHARLTIIDDQKVFKELYDSRKELEGITSKDVTLLSFPYGEHNRNILRLALKAGYKRVFTIIPSFTFSKPGEYVSGRIRTDPEDWRIEFCLKLLGAYCWLPFAYAFKRKIKRYFKILLNVSQIYQHPEN